MVIGWMVCSRAAEGINNALVTRREKVMKLLSLNRGINAATKKATAKPKKWVMSAEARKRIADAQRKRWGIIYLTPLFDMIAT
jgi:hypothetical protein